MNKDSLKKHLKEDLLSQLDYIQKLCSTMKNNLEKNREVGLGEVLQNNWKFYLTLGRYHQLIECEELNMFKE